MKKRRPSRVLFFMILALALAGFLVFVSASLGLVARGEDDASFGWVVAKQLVILLAGIGLMLLVAKIDYHRWKKLALPVFIIALILTALVFVPGIGFRSGGAYRWISLGPLTIQPSEILKYSLIIFLAAWFARSRQDVGTLWKGLVPFVVIIGLVGALMLAQPDTGTFGIMAAASLAMYLVAGAKLRHVLLLIILGALVVGGLAFTRPYIKERIVTFMNPAHDSLGSSYQLNQSLIAIGSGGLTGRGFGQSVQKFNFLPEPIGDSIFAVAAEEFGFVGGAVLIIMFGLFGLWGLKMANGIPDTFGRLLMVGIAILIVTQSFINIGSMLGLLPLTGVPLVFISHGGSALLAALFGAGIMLNASRLA